MAVFELAWTRLSHGETVGRPWLYRCARNVVGNEYGTAARINMGLLQR
ncbi:DNA-directed RNA polymerase specialized sigma24 family protein [Microbacterium natoriense]|uniref:DNA-directed RNA polymerase specialized sigma24 family protein n=2 Tax=Microbacterium natoriense TaxID=284570 RepID=A0AAW8EVQ1_9MICO|nr:DNA-directed RNA polymerase specialized sigma24 family protein [Microbacterium natoriense]